MSQEPVKWIGQSLRRVEDRRLLTGRGTFVDDLQIPHLHHAAILRSPHPHARILGWRTERALSLPGVRAVLTGEDVKKMSRPFPKAVPEPIEYYCAAVEKVRFVGEPVAVVVARDRYVAEDALDLIEVDYEPLAAVVDVEEALRPGAPILHENVGSNIANHRLLKYGDPDHAFAEADLIVREKFFFPKYSSTPMETFAVIAKWDEVTGTVTVWSNFQGPFIMHPVTATALGVPENRLRFIVPPDIGGGYGIKTSLYPYMALMALAAKKAGSTVKWIEDRREHLLASSSGTDRVTEIEAAVRKDGKILAIRKKVLDNVGGYLRTPEPACLYRTTGNQTGAYTIEHLEMDCYAVMTNKGPTGPNRGYGCQQLYFETERLVDRVAEALSLDPAEVRRRNLIPAGVFPYHTPTGGIYDSGDYPKALSLALEMADYEKLREEQRQARARGHLMGIGLATVVDPSVTNIAYVTVAYTPEQRAAPGYSPKSGSGETCYIKLDPLGRATVAINTVPEGQGHETIVSQIVADELQMHPEEVTIVSEMDTFTRSWSITTGTYSSRFASMGASAVAIAARRLLEKATRIAAHLLEADPEDIELRDGHFQVRGAPGRSISLKRVAGTAHWNPEALPEGMEPGLSVTYTHNFPTAKAPDEKDRIDSSNTYGFIADVAVVEVDPETGQVEVKKYVTVHDCGRVLHPQIVEGQIYGSLLHGLGGALYEELAYGEDGQMLSATFMDYLCPTACEAPTLKVGHVVSPSPLSVLGSKGCGESCSMSAPAALANAVADALAPLGVTVRELPLSPHRVWRLIQEGSASRTP